MKIHLLGTGAADGIPAFVGDSPVSRHARANGGKDVRTRSAALIDDHIKIDLGPDTLHQMQRENLSMEDWSAIVFTHSHEDHLCVSELQYALFPFNNREFAPFAIFANEEVCRLIHLRYPQWPFEVHETHSFVPFCHGGMKITPIHANHKTDEDSQNLLFEDGERTFLYATDTGIWPDATWEFLQTVRLDGIVIECTEGLARTSYAGHLDIEECIDVIDRLRKMGTLDSNSRVVTTHHSHSGNATHTQLEAILLPEGIEPGYDGMVIQL